MTDDEKRREHGEAVLSAIRSRAENERRRREWFIERIAAGLAAKHDEKGRQDDNRD